MDGLNLYCFCICVKLAADDSLSKASRMVLVVTVMMIHVHASRETSSGGLGELSCPRVKKRIKVASVASSMLEHQL